MKKNAIAITILAVFAIILFSGCDETVSIKETQVKGKVSSTYVIQETVYKKMKVWDSKKRKYVKKRAQTKEPAKVFIVDYTVDDFTYQDSISFNMIDNNILLTTQWNKVVGSEVKCTLIEKLKKKSEGEEYKSYNLRINSVQ